MATSQATPEVSEQSEQNAVGGTPKEITTTVFDLATFDSIQLVKTIQLPNKPTTLEEALAACGNDSAKLLDVIHEGLIAETTERERGNMEGWLVDDEDAETPVPYTGKYADAKKTKLINAAVLALAKMNGFGKGLNPEKKRELKERAKSFLRDNPAMLASLQS